LNPQASPPLSRQAITLNLNVNLDLAPLNPFTIIENDYSLKYSDILQKPEIFAKGLEEIFRSGSRVVEAVIISNLYSKIGLPCQKRSKVRNRGEFYELIDAEILSSSISFFSLFTEQPKM